MYLPSFLLYLTPLLHRTCALYFFLLLLYTLRYFKITVNDYLWIFFILNIVWILWIWSLYEHHIEPASFSLSIILKTIPLWYSNRGYKTLYTVYSIHCIVYLVLVYLVLYTWYLYSPNDITLTVLDLIV